MTWMEGVGVCVWGGGGSLTSASEHRLGEDGAAVAGAAQVVVAEFHAAEVPPLRAARRHLQRARVPRLRVHPSGATCELRVINAQNRSLLPA